MDVAVDLQRLSACESVSVHHMPFAVKGSGQAKVSSFFFPKKDASAAPGSTDIFEASFRGRLLRGTTVDLPENFTGIVIREDRTPLTDGEERTARPSATFGAISYWNLETPPTPNDPLVKALQWLDVAGAIHDPVTDEDLMAARKRKLEP